MTKALRISREISLPLDIVTKTVAILAQRRKGKTYTASVIAEEMVAAGVPFVALDPTGAWWGLRSSSMSDQAVSTTDIIAALDGNRAALNRVRGYSYGSWYRTFEGDAAARRLAQLEAYLVHCDAARVEVIAQRDALLGARPDCPTCGGTNRITNPQWLIHTLPCPDCLDGKVPIARMAAIFRQIFLPDADILQSHDAASLLDHLRSVVS